MALPCLSRNDLKPVSDDALMESSLASASGLYSQRTLDSFRYHFKVFVLALNCASAQGMMLSCRYLRNVGASTFLLMPPRFSASTIRFFDSRLAATLASPCPVEK